MQYSIKMKSSSLFPLSVICFCFMLLRASCSHAFVTIPPHDTSCLSYDRISKTNNNIGGISCRRKEWPLYSRNTSSGSNDDDDDDAVDSIRDLSATIQSSTNDNIINNTNSKYPINLPSPVLLASSMVLAIASTGSIFELSGGSPVLGFVPTLVVAIIGVPLCLFLFYAAIQKGIAETEADDAAYNNQRRGGTSSSSSSSRKW